MNLREKISAAYWAAVDRIGPLVPTPQVIGAGLSGIVVGLLDKYAIDVSVIGISPAIVAGAVALSVAWLIGPERIKGVPFDPKFDAEITPGAPELSVVGTSDTRPEPPGEFVGPEDDNAAPGTGLT